MADLVRAHDWSSTSLGPIESWSKELITIVNLTLGSPAPARTLWGPELLLIYNDAYRPIPGKRHPGALGRPASEIYREAWHVVGPLLETAISTGKTSYFEKLPVPLETEDGVQVHYLSYSYNPVYEGGKVAGLFGPLQDVTGEVVATRKLRESEARATRILQSIGDAVIVTDDETHITSMNPVAETLTGWSAAESLGLPLAQVFRIVNEETRAAVENPAEKVKRLGTIVGLANHTVLIAKDGTEVHIDDSGAPIRNDREEITGIVLVFRDINERRAAERERDAVANQLHQVLEATTDAVLSIDSDWRITYLNRPARQVLAPTGHLEGKHFWESFPDARYEGSPFVEHYYRAMDLRVAGRFEAFYPEPLNAWYTVLVQPSDDGIILFFRDVTEEKRAAARLAETADALRESEEELRWTIKLNPQIPWTAGLDGGILDVGESWLDFTGLKREDALGGNAAQAIHAEDLPFIAEAWRAAFREGKPYHIEHRVRAASGEYRWVRSRAFPRHDTDGSILKWYGNTEDIEDARRTEQALLQSEKLAAVGRLASSIAHEINNPLEAVMNLIYLARQHADSPEAQRYLESADQEIRRVSMIANQTLRFHKQPSNPQAISCRDLLSTVLSIYEGRLRNSNVEVQIHFRTECPIVCFEGDVRQVLNNLIGNAIDAMPGGGRLLIRNREATHWSTGRKGLVLTISDNGAGMSSQTVAKIFDPFFTTKGIGGTGLGLWVSQGIVTRHGGDLRVRSVQREGRCGTVFTLFLPFDAPHR